MERSSSLTQSTSSKVPIGENYSTLTLLEHIHLLNTNVHKQPANKNQSGSEMIDFFVHTLGFGIDPKSLDSLSDKKGVVFVNCGPTQLHLNDDNEFCRKLEELRQNEFVSSKKHYFEIGLRCDNLKVLTKQLSSRSSDFCFHNVTKLCDGREVIKITDIYDRVFVAREVIYSNDDNNKEEPTISSICQQKIIYNNETFAQLYPPNIVEQYGVQIDQTICRGIDYLEFFVFVTKEDAGKTVESIARFYDFFFDAPTSLVNDGTSNIAIIGFGKIDENGRAEQSLLFREIVVDEPQQHQVVNSKDLGTGHHITIYVGNCDADFEVAASNCVDGELLWVNPHFLDRVLDVDEAMKCKQFRFKDIVDIHTGETLYVLEHEIRSISHPLFPGRS